MNFPKDTKLASIERRLAKAKVAGLSPVSRSNFSKLEPFQDLSSVNYSENNKNI